MTASLVLLTGASGFVGRQVMRALNEQGDRVRVIVREGRQNQLERLPCIESIITTKDLFRESADWWGNACKGVSAVVHAAWYAEPGKYLQSPLNLDCLMGTLQLAKAAAQAKVQRFVGVGTCFEYDLSVGTLATDTPLNPSTPYAGAKAAVFMALKQWLPDAGVSFAWGRLFYLYGEGEDARRLVPYLRTKLAAGEVAELTSGAQVRDFLDIVDAGKILAQAVHSSKQGAFNICSGIPITVRQLAEKIADEYGRRDLLKFGARPDNLVDPPYVVGVKAEG